MRDNELTLLTTDHTLGAPGTTHALTRAVGAQDSLRVDHFKETAHLHDRYLSAATACMAHFRTKQIHALLARRAAPEETARELVEQAAASTDSDNCDGARARYSRVARRRSSPTWSSPSPNSRCAARRRAAP